MEANIAYEERRLFGIDVYKGHLDEVVRKMKDYGMDINEILWEDRDETILQQAVGGLEHNDTLPLIQYLLEQGANPNLRSKSGYNAFHLALYRENLELTELMLKHGAEVNNRDSDGHTAFFLFLKKCYGKYARKGVPLKLRCLAIMETFLQNGADPDIPNNYGSSVRNGSEQEMQSVLTLLAKYDALNIEKAVPQKQKRKTNLKYPEVFNEIWKKYVPASGESNTVQGELLRCIEKLRDEAQRNGNINYGDWHKSLAEYVRDTLIGSGMFDEKEIRADIKPLTYKTRPYLEDDIYDRFCDRICEFQLKNPEPIYIQQNEK